MSFGLSLTHFEPSNGICQVQPGPKVGEVIASYPKPSSDGLRRMLGVGSRLGCRNIPVNCSRPWNTKIVVESTSLPDLSEGSGPQFPVQKPNIYLLCERPSCSCPTSDLVDNFGIDLFTGTILHFRSLPIGERPACRTHSKCIISSRCPRL
jgi:hypothetical protein